ncbi:DUF397 domain-containing protein [Lipingzhangella sp. LS1_29]|uniref:DUF397 domain-containing protein n=1 Tax=Lipingzhangella rawalii TaxID=2055835 RepID=A0ABU2H0X7_9ACTN|nr:DUF397 domain-containing protein [Lipingzhangella rawalii]MDS1268958.1 DUF397 domain-containing protein [Lipingzhangella rawalii]
MSRTRAAEQATSTPRRWHTASYTQERGECVEVSEGAQTGVRDSKQRSRGALYFPAAEWRAFLAAVRNGDL